MLWHRVAILACVMAGASGPTIAHHSGAMFDDQKRVTLDGVVTGYDWTSPHIWMHVVVKGDDGNDQVWDLQGNAPAVLLRNGWSKVSMKPGDKISVAIHPLKDGSHGGSFIEATVNGAHLGHSPPGA